MLSTKVGRYGQDVFDFSAERVTKSVDESLARLNVDYIDIIQCHDIEYGSLDQVGLLRTALTEMWSCERQLSGKSRCSQVEKCPQRLTLELCQCEQILTR